MTTIARISRLARIIADLPLAIDTRLPYAVTKPILGPQTFLRATTIGMAIGYDVVRVEIGKTRDAAAFIAARVDDAATGGRPFILVDARTFDMRDPQHVDTLKDAASVARANWDLAGDAAMLVVTEEPEDVAHLLGRQFDDAKWAKSIA